jgi:G3E family GTPase
VPAIPTLLLTGADRSAKTSFLRSLLAIRPPRERWALLDNDGNPPELSGSNDDFSFAVVSGCACCTGQVSLQTGIVRLLRESKPQRLVIVVAAAAEPAALTQTLRQEHLAASLLIARSLCIVSYAMQSAAEAAQCLWLRQMQAADDVVAMDEIAVTALNGRSPRIIGPAEARTLALAALAKAARR